MVVPEGGSLFQMDITLIQDGNSTLEHNIPQRVYYDDVLSLLVADPGQLQPDPGRHLWRAWPAIPIGRRRHGSGTIPLLTRHAPPAVLAAQNVAPDDWRRTTRLCRRRTARARRKSSPQRGVQISIGGHGQQPGIGDHWELWSPVRGGCEPDRGAARGDRSCRRHRSASARHRLARARQARRPRHPRRRPDRGHPQQRPDPPGDAGGRLYDGATLNESRHRQPPAPALLVGDAGRRGL